MKKKKTAYRKLNFLLCIKLGFYALAAIGSIPIIWCAYMWENAVRKWKRNRYY